MTSYYDGRLEGAVRYRIDPAPFWWISLRGGWRLVMNGFTGFRLTVTDEVIEVHSFRRRLLELMAPGAKLQLLPRETTMGTLRLGRELGQRREYIALTCKRPGDSVYTLAVRPSDGNVDRLRNALQSAGVREAYG